MKNNSNSANKLTHTDESGKANMVDIGGKPILSRRAFASGFIELSEHTVEVVRANALHKGDVLSVAQIAGIQAAKQTPALIPLCHTLWLDKVSINFEITEHGIKTNCSVDSVGKTGVEMEALTAVSVALLTIYDMCKAIDKTMIIKEIRLLKKEKKKILNG